MRCQQTGYTSNNQRTINGQHNRISVAGRPKVSTPHIWEIDAPGVITDSDPLV